MITTCPIPAQLTQHCSQAHSLQGSSVSLHHIPSEHVWHPPTPCQQDLTCSTRTTQKLQCLNTHRMQGMEVTHSHQGPRHNTSRATLHLNTVPICPLHKPSHNLGTMGQDHHYQLQKVKKMQAPLELQMTHSNCQQGSHKKLHCKQKPHPKV